MIKEITIETFDRIGQLNAACLDMLREAGRDCVFLSPDWFGLLEQYGLPAGQSPRYYVATDQQNRQPLVILPMMGSVASGFPGGKTLSSLSSFYSMDYAPIMAGDNQQALNALVAFILAERPSWDVIDIRMLTEGAEETAALRAAFAASGARTDDFFQFYNWIHRVNGQSAAAYYADRPSRMKNTIRRKQKKFEESYKLSFLLVTGEENMEKAIADYQSIYDKSWKDGEAFPHFIPNFMRVCAKAGMLRLGVIYADEKPVAAQFWIIYGGTAMIYKLAYDEEYAPLSAGSILSKHLMDHAIDVDGVQILDYGVGDEGYKRDWMTEQRQKVGLVAFNNSWRGIYAALRHFGARKLKAGLSHKTENKAR